MSEDETPNKFALLTTHSESLLNALYPEEIILTSIDEGITRCTRSQDPNKIDELIRETGFGFGYFIEPGL